MALLDDTVWKHFLLNDRFDGRRFEKLAKIILKNVYGGEWTGTQTTHDQGRDFELSSGPFERPQAWAECKMHKDPIALTTIGNTLVMALVTSINRLVLISLSPLSKDAAKQIGHFALCTSCLIDVIAGPGLENLLLRYPEILREAEPDLDFAALPKPLVMLPPEVTFDIDFNPDVIVLAGKQDTPPRGGSAEVPVLHPGSDFLISVYVHNRMPKETLSVTIRVEWTSSFTLQFGKPATEQCHEIRCVAEPQQFATERLRFRVSDMPGLTCLPNVVVSVADLAEPFRLPAQQVEISPVAMITTLIGKAEEQIANLVRECRVPGKIKCFVVDGRSGVGKTRFLAETAWQLWSFNYNLLRLDLEELSGRAENETLLIRHVLAQIHALPLLERESSALSEERRRILRTDDNQWVEQILYDGLPLDSDQNRNRCAEVIVKGMARRRTAFLIDNAQQVSLLEQKILERVVELAQGKGEAVLVLAFNHDKIFGDSPGSHLFQACLDRCRNSSGYWQRYTLQDFERTDIQSFLNAALKPRAGEPHQFTREFPRTTDTILKHSAPRPLYLWHMLLHLYDAGILKREGGYFVPRNSREFADAVKCLPDEIRKLLEFRWSNTVAATGSANLETLGALIGLFFTVPAWVTLELNIPPEEIALLQQGGFARKVGDVLSPSHQEVFRLFEERPIPPSLARRLCEIIERLGLRKSQHIAYFLCRDVLEEIDPPLLQLSFERLRNQTVDVSEARGHSFLHRLIDILDSDTSCIAEPQARLAMLCEAIKTLSGITSHRRLTTPLATCFNFARREMEVYRGSGAQFFNFVHLISNIEFGRNSYRTPYDLMRQAVLEETTFLFASPVERDLHVGSLLNRLGVASMCLGRRDEAVQFATKARKIGYGLKGTEALAPEQQERAVRLCIEAEIDLGNIDDLLTEGSEPARKLHHWRTAGELFKAELSPASDVWNAVAPMVWFYQARVLIAEKRTIDAATLLDKAIFHSRQFGNAYHGIRNIVLLGILGVLDGDEGAREDQVGTLLNSALDWTIASGAAHAEWGILLLRGETAALQGQYGIAGELAMESLQAFLETDPDSAMIRLRGNYLSAAMSLLRTAEILGLADGFNQKTQRLLDDLTRDWGAAIRRQFERCVTLDEADDLRCSITANAAYLRRGYPLLSQ